MVLVVTIRHRANGPLFPPKERQTALSTNDVTNFWSLLRDSNIKPDQCKSLVYGKVTFGNKFSSSLKMFIVKGNKIQLGFDNKYPENNKRMQRQR